mmetsp:Transcript_22062/g.25137  ORF Transcript_22062/g.25137 Transcript_22062/m.25137 type:complete len:117 (-) Transcript_22062:1023-1373(-)
MSAKTNSGSSQSSLSSRELPLGPSIQRHDKVHCLKEISPHTTPHIQPNSKNIVLKTQALLSNRTSSSLPCNSTPWSSSIAFSASSASENLTVPKPFLRPSGCSITSTCSTFPIFRK